MQTYIIAETKSGTSQSAQKAASTEVGDAPRYDLDLLGRRLGATFEPPTALSVSFKDKLLSKIVGSPDIWSFANQFKLSGNQDKLLFCPSEDIAIPVAASLKKDDDSVKIAAVFHNINRPRGRLAMSFFSTAKQIDLFLVHSYSQLDFLRHQLQIPDSRVRLVPYSIDGDFFTPGPAAPDKSRPVLASVGLEKRDYRLLAAATQDLDVDVKISGYSQYARDTSSTFPEVSPANLSRRFYEWSELVQLYRDADIVVVCLQENPYAAGVTTLLEAMACKRPVIVTRTEGLVDYLLDESVMLTVEPGDEAGLRRAIQYLLDNPEEAAEKAERGYQIFLERYRLAHYIETLAESLESLSSNPVAAPLSGS